MDIMKNIEELQANAELQATQGKVDPADLSRAISALALLEQVLTDCE